MLLLLYVAGGSFIIIFDGSAFQMTLPIIQKSLGGTIQEVEWTMTSFLLVSTSTLLPFGRAGDVLGRERVWRAGVLLFVLASTFCAVAPSLAWLVIGRAAQGSAAAMVTANSAAILVDAFPDRGGRMLGLGNIALALGMIAGPPVGAILTGAASWRLIFVIGVPVGVLVWFGSRPRLPHSPRARADLDIGSGLLSVLGLGATLVGITFGHRWGWTSIRTCVSLAIGIAFSVAFFGRQRRLRQPLLETSLLGQPMFVSGLLSSFFGFGALFAALAALPYLLLVTQHRHLTESGTLVGVLPLVLSLTAPVAGTLTDRFGSRMVCTASLLAMAAAFVVILTGGDDVGTGRLIWALALAGAGLGGFEAPNDVDVLRSLPRDRLSVGSAMLSAVRNLGMTFGVALGATMLEYANTNGQGDVAARTALGAAWALTAAAASAAAGALTVLIRPGRKRARA